MAARPLRAGAALLLAAAVAAGACAGRSQETDPPAAADETAVAGGTTTTTTDVPETDEVALLDGGPIVVGERGFSLVPDPVDPRATLGAYGVIVENWDTELLASGVTVTIRLLDAAGGELLSSTALLNGVGPAQRMATGRILVEPIEGLATIDAEVDVAAWLPPVHDGPAFEAEEVTSEVTDDGGMTTRFVARSRWPEAEEGVDATALYRAADGRILGAETTTLPVVRAGEQARAQIQLLAPIPDVARTEVFLGRGFSALTSG